MRSKTTAAGVSTLSRTSPKTALLVLLGLASAVLGKHSITLQQEKPKLKAPHVQKYDTRACAFDDAMNFACLESSIDLKAGWEIKQRWEVATDINPTAPSTLYTGTAPVAAFVYLDPDTEANVGYKYRLRLQPYSVFFFNLKPTYKIDRLVQQELQFNIDQFTSMFYFEFVYYQKAIKYSYTPS